MIWLGVLYLFVGAFIAGISEPRAVRILRLLLFLLIWPFILVAVIGHSIAKAARWLPLNRALKGERP